MARVTLRFMVVTSRRMTADEFLATPPDNAKTQLLDGELVEMDARTRHQDVVGYVLYRLMRWIEARPDVGKAGTGCNWRMDDRNVFIPDVWFRRPENLQPGDRIYLDGAPDLAVEVRSESTWRYDKGHKKDFYLARGAEVWLVDTAVDQVVVCRGDETHTYGRGDTLTTPLLPGFEIDVTTLFDR